MMKPSIHLNGSPASRLAEAYLEAGSALYKAMRALEETAPNARDYYVQSDTAYSVAQKEHRERLLKLQSIINDMQELHEHCEDSGR